MATLLLKPVSHGEVKAAVAAWHYSRTVSAAAILNLGVWEEGRFIGALTFGNGNLQIGSPYGLDPREVCELNRVALDQHETPVSRIVSVALKLLRKHRDSVRLVVSYADSGQGHLGGIYQAGNWAYVGMIESSCWLIGTDGVARHPRTMYDKYPDSALRATFPRVRVAQKHKYLYPFDNAMKALIEPLKLPYPRVASIAGDAPGPQSGQGGSTPTVTLTKSRIRAARKASRASQNQALQPA